MCLPCSTPAPVKSVSPCAYLLLDSIRLPYSPARADLVAAVGETTGESALKRMLERMQATSSGRDILAERPRITVTSLSCYHIGLGYL